MKKQFAHRPSFFVHRPLALLSMLLATFSVSYGQVSLESALKLHIPVVTVHTVNNERPTATQVDPPEGCTGIGATNKTKVPGSLAILLQDETLYDSGNYVEGVRGMRISLRGNSSAFATKSPYKIKLEKKANLMMDGKVGGEDKEWLLLREDATCINTFVGFWVNERIGLQWTPRHQFVNLFFNDEYEGLYLLCESVKRNNDCRLAVDKKEGAIFEYDPYFWDESLSISPGWNWPEAEKMAYTFKYPKEEDFTTGKVAHYQALFATFESSVLDGTYDQHIDVSSFARWLLAHDILGTADGAGSNIFMTQKDDASPIRMANLWDFDTILKQIYWSNQHYRFFFPILLESENDAFRNEYIRLWKELSPTIVTELLAYVDAFVASPQGQSVKISRQYDISKYWFRTTLEEEVANLHRYMTNRKEWLDFAFAKEIDTTGIEEHRALSIEPRSSTNDDEVEYYDLMGRKASPSRQHGNLLIRRHRNTGNVEKVFK